MAKPVPLNEADYVVVGSGSAGSAVAGRLAASGASVIMLEAGKNDKNNKLVTKPGMIGPLHSVPQLQATVDWGYRTTPQQHVLNRQIPQTRGKVLGGSSSVNGLLWVRGNRQNYDDWAAEGNTGWDADSVNAAYKRVESFEDGENEFRGGAGPIKVVRHPDLTEGALQFQQATAETLDVKILDDYNGAEQEGISTFQMNADTNIGLRYSSSRGYVHNQHLPTLQVQTQQTVTKILLEGTRAVGVEVSDKKGNRRTIRAGKEVILSAGVFGSAQILQLSGIGPAAHLATHGIDVVADLPVGDNLHDHMFVPMTFEMANTPHVGSPAYFAKGFIKETLKPGSTFLRHSVFENTGFVRTSLATKVPDMQIHVLPWAYPSPNQDEKKMHQPPKVHALTVFSTLIYPHSRGTLRLASADPHAAPLIDFNYLADPRDSQVLHEGITMIREIMRSKAFGNNVLREVYPGPEYSDEAMKTELLNRATTVYHGVGSCRMGVDERAVVGPDLKVRGIENLRVADASIMPSIIGGNTNAPSIMIGDQCAELILKG